MLPKVVRVGVFLASIPIVIFYVQLQRFEATKKTGEWLENKYDNFMDTLAE